MEVHRRNPKPNHHPTTTTAATTTTTTTTDEENNQPKASDALPLPLYITNTLFFSLFFFTAYFLLLRWGDKIRNSIPLHVLTFSELAAIVTLSASLIYLFGFFGINFVQPSSTHDHHIHPISPSAHDHDSNDNDNNNNNDDHESLVQSILDGSTPSYALETRLKDCLKAAFVRREAVQRITGKSLEGLPLYGFDYDSILNKCCEMPVGYVQIPVGVAGPLLLDGKEYAIPMATTEGCLVASANRGCKAIFASGGATSYILKDGMSRAPIVRFPSAKQASQLKFFLEDPLNFDTISDVFNQSSQFARLQSIKCTMVGKNLYIRFSSSTGDAMGMNMTSKAVEQVLNFLQDVFPDMDVIGISGNLCSDKKPAAVNWIEGRGKSVVSEAVIKEDVLKRVLRTNVAALVELNVLKNLTGSAVAGSLGGFNAHASNIVSAIFMATGQDPAQNVESSHCITMMEPVNGGKDLHISVSMPSIEVGTVGGGTVLASQAACLNLLGVKGGSEESAGANSRLLATIVAGSVLAGELSLMAAIAEGELVRSHMKYNRSTRDVTKATTSCS